MEHKITIKDDIMKIEIFGSGCPKCIELEKRAREAVLRVKLKATFDHIYDINQIVERGIFITPALVVDGKVLFEGKIPSVDELVIALTKR
jgi:small redox-active disulfide protein 2